MPQLTFLGRLYVAMCFNDAPATEIYTLSLHDALPILGVHLHSSRAGAKAKVLAAYDAGCRRFDSAIGDRKSTRLNSSHTVISYAVFCLKKKTDHGGDGQVQLREPRLGHRAAGDVPVRE